MATWIFWVALGDKESCLQRAILGGAVWFAATLLWTVAMAAVLNLAYNAYYLAQSPAVRRTQVPRIFVSLESIGYGFPSRAAWWSLAALAGALALSIATVFFAGWRLSRCNRSSQTRC